MSDTLTRYQVAVQQRAATLELGRLLVLRAETDSLSEKIRARIKRERAELRKWDGRYARIVLQEGGQ